MNRIEEIWAEAHREWLDPKKSCGRSREQLELLAIERAVREAARVAHTEYEKGNHCVHKAILAHFDLSEEPRK